MRIYISKGRLRQNEKACIFELAVVFPQPSYPNVSITYRARMSLKHEWLFHRVRLIFRDGLDRCSAE
jgi:hypothetical protein